jgi:hypothetical protein
MNTEIKNNNVIITLPLNPAPSLSSTGKTFIIAGTGGFVRTTAIVNGKPVSISVNVTIPAK